MFPVVFCGSFCLLFPHYSLMTSEGATTLLKNNKSHRGGKSAFASLQRPGDLPREVCCSSTAWQTTAPGPGLSQAPAVRTCFIFGPSTESRKPHLLTSFSFKITHSSRSLVEKASMRDFLSLFQERIGKTETQTPFLGKQHPPSQRPKQVCTISYSLFKFHFIPPAPPHTHTQQAAPQAEIVFGFI